MYAAAGGASLASRQARQRQRQQKKTQQLQAKLHPPKAAGLASDHAAEGASTPTRSQSRQFHQLPQNYLRAPQPHGRKLSATYTTQSKLLLPIEEGDTQSVSQLRMHSHAHSHGHAYAHSHSHSHGPAHAAPAPLSHHGQTPYQQFASSHGRVSPKLVHRHSGSSSSAGFHPVISAGQLHKSATATLPLVSHMEAEAMEVSPSAVAGVKTTVTSLETATPTSPPLASTSAAAAAAMAAEAEAELAGAGAMFVPHHDAIIVTPATPMASPGHVAKLRRPGPEELLFDSSAERQPLTADETLDDEDEPMHPPAPGQLERKCSVYRMRRSDAFEQDTGGASGGVGGAGGGLKRQLRELQFSTGVQQTQYEPLLADEPQLIFKGLGVNGRKMQICAYCEEGICVCEHLECAQGRAAWLERGRRCSVQDQQQQQATCHRRWVKRNRIQDASLGGSSDDEDFLGVLRGPSTFANAFLYVGLGTVALGLVIAFVGTGEKGFKTTELRLIGPSLIGLGLICCILRILFCICPSHCISSSKKTRKKNGNKIDADHTTSLLRNESKRVSIARGPSFQVPKYPLAHKRSQSKMLNEGMEALRQIATTSLFMQNEQKTAINRVVPIINEPESGDAPLEMKKLQTALNACEMSDDEQDQDQDQQKQQQIAKRTTATTAVTSSTTKDPTSTAATSRITRATTLSTVDEKPDSKLVRQRVALQQQRQQQQQQQQDQQHVPKSQSLSSSSTVKDSLEVVEETSLIDASNETTTPVATTGASSTAPMPSSCSTGAIPRLNRPGISTGATPKTTTTTTTPTITARLPTSQSHPTSYDLPPALPHTYSATATVRGPLGMSMSSSTSGKGMGTAFTLPPTTTTISLLPLPAPSTVATASSTSTTIACIPGQVLETSGVTSLSLSLMRPATASGVVLSGLTTSSFTTGTDHQKSHPSSAGSVMGRGSSLLLSPPTAAAASSSSSSSKFEPELVLSPANLGQ
ncbi:uncharacterized protein LOC6617880 isoform X1 [Drosophila sechellia]|uniref:uncharacterized protein LOC6617880 isoform X1 n=1 Tax=Drosophila sechellia TaxID=7238 RepID=UPI0013DDD849|nr:uncharacterized protein LOC6617880 isoform X1 [Drosophila sechellia]